MDRRRLTTRWSRPCQLRPRPIQGYPRAGRAAHLEAVRRQGQLPDFVAVPMRSSARIHNSQGQHHIKLSTGDRTSKVEIPPKPTGFGSSASGGELLMLALATCYCNDVYREAAKQGIDVSHVDVECSADFPAEGQPAKDITYIAKITANASEQQIRDLAAQADRLAEIQNTVRSAIPVTIAQVEVETV